MKRKSVWTKGLLVLTLAIRAQAGEFYTLSEFKNSLKKARAAVNACEKSKCKKLAELKENQKMLESAVVAQTKVDLLSEENNTLRQEAAALQKSQPIPKLNACQKPQILKDKMIEMGINENGSMIYAKRPAGMESAHCWANSRKKQAATAVLCEFPLAVNIMTKGGDPKELTEKKQEYMFDLKGCNLVSVRVTEESRKKKKETFLSSALCQEQWKKRTADAGMTKVQADTMEETIKQCFLYQLL